MKRLIIFLLLVSYFVSSSVFAGNKDFNFRRFTAADGLSSNTVRAILQDKRGYVWFGTDEGLNRYDGTGVKIYQYTTQTTHGLGCNYISALYEGEDELWVGTGEVYIFMLTTLILFLSLKSRHRKVNRLRLPSMISRRTKRITYGLPLAGKGSLSTIGRWTNWNNMSLLPV